MKKLFLDTVKKQIKKAKVVSFDIFDTLLLRPYIKPIDVFVHMERALERPGFATERVDAERRTRVRHPELEDITLDMIYDEIDEKFQDMKQSELEWEEMVLRANPEMKAVYDYAKSQGKKVIITSDMYLPTKFIAKILRKNGYDDWDKLYVSGQLNKTKGHGSLWAQILKDTNVQNAKEILHIGDNPRGDRDVPKNYGFTTKLYPTVVQQYKKIDAKARAFCAGANTLGASILAGFFAYKWISKQCGLITDKNYWSWLGYNYGGPLHFAYAKFIEQDALNNNTDHLLFVAREGYILQKVFNKINPNFKTSYVYAQRALNLICNLDYNPLDLNHTSYLVSYCAEQVPAIKEKMDEAYLSNSHDYHFFIQANLKLFQNFSAKKANNYSKYLNKIVKKKDKVSVVADMGHTFAALKLIRSVFPGTARGVFFINSAPLLDDNNGVFAYSCFQPGRVFSKRETDAFTKNWDLVEFLMSSPEHSVKEIDENGQPVYDPNPSEYEIKRSELYPDVVDGALSFTDDVLSMFQGNDIYLDYLTLIRWLNCFIDAPQKIDIKNWADIYFFRLVNNTTPSQSFSLHFPWTAYVFHPSKTKEAINGLFWKTPFQKWYVKHWAWSTTEIVGDKKIKLKMGGIIKIVKKPLKKEIFVLGARVYRKKKIASLKFNDVATLITNSSRMVIDTLGLKIQRAFNVAFLHQKTFGDMRNKHSGQTMALVGAGPTVKFLEPLPNTIYVGLNRAFLRDDIHFDYLFSIDKAGLNPGKEQFYDGFLNYDCIKFMGDQNMGANFQIPQPIMYQGKNIRMYKTKARYLRDSFALDLETEALANSCSCSLQAMQFILFTNPKKVYVYGIDCSCASGQHFTGSAVNNVARGENPAAIDAQHIADWRRLKDFVNTYYPDTEIYIVNPVGLKGIFHDVYTKSYLEKHPEIDESTVEILDKENI